MNNQLRTIDTAALAQLSKALVGFDRYINMHQPTSSNYPPHNIVKYSDDTYAIEVAVAGFSEGEITIQLENSVLTITGNKIHDLNDKKEYLHRGLAARDFEQTWTLAEYMNVTGAEVKDGMLKISIERIVPEALKPRQIEVK